MKNIVKILILLFNCVILLPITGCWDNKEIVDKIIVVGTAIDYDKKNNGIILTAEIILPTQAGKESNFTSKIYQSKGKNILEAKNNLIPKAGHETLWSHSKVIILSKEIMNEQNLFIGIMDWVERDRETSQNVWLLLSEEKTAGEILSESAPQTEQGVSFYLDHLFLTVKDSETYIRTPYWKFMNDLQSISGCSALPCVHIENSQTGKIAYLSGSELLKGAKPVCHLDEEQTKIQLLVNDSLKNTTFILKQLKNETPQTVSIKIINNKSTIIPIYREGVLVMDILLEMEAIIEGIDSVNNIFKPDIIKNLEVNAQNMISDEITSLLTLCQEQNGIDVFGFGNKIEKKYPKLWKQIENDWQTIFPQITSDIQINLKITGSNESMGITKVGK